MADKLSIFDKVSVVTIAGAGLIEAAQQALKDADQVKTALPMLDLGGAWNYVPLALIIVGAASWVLKRMYQPLENDTHAAATDAAVAPAQFLAKVTGPSKADARVFVGPEVTPKTFQDLYKGRTDLEGRKLAEAYSGKWMKVRGRFQNVSSNRSGIHNIHFEDADPPQHYTLHARFTGNVWGERLETLQIGQEVAIAGKIDEPGRHYFWLMDCELIPLSEASDAFQMSAKPRRTRTRKAAAK